MPSSTDVGDVSWLCPTAQVIAATACAGTPPHSWQNTAQSKSGIGHKGMLYAGKALAGGAVDLMLRPELLEQARQDWEKELDGQTYQSMPADVRPSVGSGTEE